ncbi:hypothetical protein CRH09_00455 [Nocardia terpenica]|uniref:Uncharacterized protein n=1 Tax=Nocardia terpenica TaxID=455432 RepID=A0A291RCA9_9NOCA|nr:hypothetical protein CRH09_00455 [Nocardia terpenica]
MDDFAFPTPFTVRHYRYSEEQLPSGRLQREWVDQGDKPVIGWNPPDTRTGGDKLAGPDRAVVDLELMVPADFGEAGHLDKIILPDLRFPGGEARTWFVLGLPEDMGTGPFDFRPGMIINLRHTQG